MENKERPRLTRHELAELYKQVMEEEVGLVAKIDNDNDVLFRYPELGTMFFSLDAEDDPEYMMLIYPNFASAERLKLTREQLLLAINLVNTHNKVIKLGIRPDSIETSCEVMATIEAFVAAPDEPPTPEFIKGTIKRNLSALRTGVRNFINEAKRMSAPAPGDGAKPDDARPTDAQ
jgi:hypothetical protein